MTQFKLQFILMQIRLSSSSAASTRGAEVSLLICMTHSFESTAGAIVGSRNRTAKSLGGEEDRQDGMKMAWLGGDTYFSRRIGYGASFTLSGFSSNLLLYCRLNNHCQNQILTGVTACFELLNHLSG